MPGKHHKSTDVERIQAVTMVACGKTTRDVEAVVGIAPPALSQLQKALSRGYVIGGEISEDFVKDGTPTLSVLLLWPPTTPSLARSIV
jgi:hypothetical protein